MAVNNTEQVVSYILISIITLIIIYFVYGKVKYYFLSIKIKSDVDGEYYIVKKSTPEKQQASANILAGINKRVLLLIDTLKNVDNANVNLLRARYSRGSLTENILDEDTTFTINKGKEISFCITTRDSKENIYDINKLMYVALHELAHVGCKSIGHGEEFVKFFRFLVKQAIDTNLYTYIDYSSKPEEYCGIQLTQSIL